METEISLNSDRNDSIDSYEDNVISFSADKKIKY